MISGMDHALRAVLHAVAAVRARNGRHAAQHLDGRVQRAAARLGRERPVRLEGRRRSARAWSRVDMPESTVSTLGRLKQKRYAHDARLTSGVRRLCSGAATRSGNSAKRPPRAGSMMTTGTPWRCGHLHAAARLHHRVVPIQIVHLQLHEVGVGMRRRAARQAPPDRRAWRSPSCLMSPFFLLLAARSPTCRTRRTWPCARRPRCAAGRSPRSRAPCASSDVARLLCASSACCRWPRPGTSWPPCTRRADSASPAPP